MVEWENDNYDALPATAAEKQILIFFDALPATAAEKQILIFFDLVRNFKPMTSKEMMKISVTLTAFFESKTLDWIQPGYRDGALA